MSISVPRTITKDWRGVEQEDATANRRIAIKNIQREIREMAPQWKKSQQKLYGNMLDVTPEVSLGQVIINEGLPLMDTENNIAIAITELTKIADRTVAEYVVDRLEPSEILYLVVNLKGIVRNIKKTKSRLDKDMFIEIIKQTARDNPINMNAVEDDDAVVAAAAPAQVSKTQIPLSSVGVLRKEQKENMEKQQQRLRNESAEEILRRDLVNKVKNIEERNLLSTRNDDLLNNANYSAPTIISRTLTPNPTSPPPISPINKMTPERMSTILDRSLEKTSKKRSSSRFIKPKRLYDPQTGKGMMIYGRGYNLSEKSKKNRHYLNDDKFYVELHKLKENILSVKYASNDAPLTTIRVQNISNDLKDIIEDVLKNKYNERIFQQLNPNDKRVFKRFIKGVKIDSISFDDDLDKQFHKDYQILKGQFESGNTSPEIKNALKRYVIEGLAENRINKNEAHFLLYQLSL